MPRSDDGWEPAIKQPKIVTDSNSQSFQVLEETTYDTLANGDHYCLPGDTQVFQKEKKLKPTGNSIVDSMRDGKKFTVCKLKEVQ